MKTRLKFFLFPMLFIGAVLFFTTGCSDDDTELPNITGLTVEEAENGLSISWSSMEGVNSYTLSVAESESGPFEMEALLRDMTLRNWYTYTDGTPGETYYFRVVWNDGSQTSSEAEAQIVSGVFPAPPVALLSDLTLETTTDLPNSQGTFQDNSLKWNVSPDHEDYDKIDGFKIGFKREGRAEFSGMGFSFGSDIEYWEVLQEGDDLSRSGDAYTYNVGLFGQYRDDDEQLWATDDRAIDYKVIAVDANGEELKTLVGNKKLELFDEVRKVEAERDGDDVIIKFTGSTLATHYELEVNLHGYDWTFHDTGTNKIVLSTSDVNKINEWGINAPPKTPYMYEIRLTGVPRADGGIHDRHTYIVTPGKSSSGPFDGGSNSDRSF